MWIPATRKNYSRNGLRYQSDVTDEEWRVIEPYLPPAKGIGRPRGWPLREIVNGISTRCALAVRGASCRRTFRPASTVYRWFAAWRDACLFEKINHALVITDRGRVGREASPSAAIIDSQSIKTTEAGGPAVMMPARRSTGANVMRWLNTDGRGLMIEPHPASIQDRDGGGPLLQASRRLFPFIERGSLLMADMPANASPPRPASSSKSSPRARIRSALLFCRADGWSSGSLPGSAATEGLPKISRPASTPPGPSFTPLPSCCSHAASRGTHEFRNRLLAGLSDIKWALRSRASSPAPSMRADFRGA